MASEWVACGVEDVGVGTRNPHARAAVVEVCGGGRRRAEAGGGGGRWKTAPCPCP